MIRNSASLDIGKISNIGQVSSIGSILFNSSILFLTTTINFGIANSHRACSRIWWLDSPW